MDILEIILISISILGILLGGLVWLIKVIVRTEVEDMKKAIAVLEANANANANGR